VTTLQVNVKDLYTRAEEKVSVASLVEYLVSKGVKQDLPVELVSVSGPPPLPPVEDVADEK
jgi:hypothetical protein